MGEVVRFPDERGYKRRGAHVDSSTEPATVIILPVIRVNEREVDEQRLRHVASLKRGNPRKPKK